MRRRMRSRESTKRHVQMKARHATLACTCNIIAHAIMVVVVVGFH